MPGLVTKLILHIGTEKTGSTALQVFLKRHERALFASGIVFPDLFQTVNAGELYLSGASGEFTDYLDDYLFRGNFRFREKYIKQLGKELGRLAGKDHCRVCILSSELLYSRIRHSESLRRLKSNLFGCFDDIQIVCYIRNQAERVLGLSMEVLKQGRHLQQIRSPRDHVYLDSSCDYRISLSRWMEVFPGRVTVRRYERSSLVNGDIIDDFLHVIEQPDLVRLPKPRPLDANRSLTRDQFKVINYLNSKNLNHEKNGSIMKSVLKSMSNRSAHGKVRPTKELGQYCRDRYQSSDEWVRSTFFSGDQFLWTESVDLVDSQSLELGESMASIVDALIAEQNKPEFLIAQSLSVLLRPSQLMILLKGHCIGSLARLYEALANSSSSLLMLKCKAYANLAKYQWWSWRLP